VGETPPPFRATLGCDLALGEVPNATPPSPISRRDQLRALGWAKTPPPVRATPRARGLFREAQGALPPLTSPPARRRARAGPNVAPKYVQMKAWRSSSH
jgi:hypothetical protein